ncbi:MAG: hypothetical protein FJ098_11740 [Deltaproteobacteria bacterium]|nr:hypothetical protein [Deltaproteobacteria bacterium]
MRRWNHVSMLLVLLVVPAMRARGAAAGEAPSAAAPVRPLVWSGPRLLPGDDPPPLYAVLPVPADVTAAALVCAGERVELGLPIWTHPARTGHAWVVPPNPVAEAPRCILEVSTDREIYRSEERIRLRSDAPCSEVLLPAAAAVAGSGGGGLSLRLRNLEGDVRVRLVSLTRGRSVDWIVSLPPGATRVQIPLPEEVLDPGEYLLAIEGNGGRGAVCDQPVFVAGEALVDLEEVRLEPLGDTHSWLVLAGDGAEDIVTLSLETPAGRLPLILEPVEGASLPSVRARIRTELLRQFDTVSFRVEESDGLLRLDVGDAVAASDRSLPGAATDR